MITLGELFKFGSGKIASLQDDSEFPVFGANGVIGFTTASLYDSGIILGRVGAYCGSVHYSSGKFWATDNTIIAKSLGRNVIDEKFGYYLLGNLDLNRYAGGSAQPLLTQTVLKKLEVKVPSLPTQRKIAAVLSAYDDLIENNTRRVQVLEQMARALYREWFVEYRFPSHETAEFVEDEQGRRPAGWEWLPFSEMFGSTLGGDWGSDEAKGNDKCLVRVVRGTDFEDLVKGTPIRCPVRFIDSKSLEKRKLQENDLIVENSINAKTRSAGTPFLVDNYSLDMLSVDAIAASFCKVYRPKIKYMKFIPLAYYYLDHMVMTGQMEYFQNIATNGIANLQSRKLIAEGRILIPPSQIIDRILPLISDTQIKILVRRIQNLRQTRDLLLPKLVSGELDVSALDIRGPGLEAQGGAGETGEAVA